MNGQRIAVRVSAVELEQPPYYGLQAPQERIKLTFSGEAQPGVEHVTAFLTLQAGVPQPFSIGQRLALVFEVDQNPVVTPEEVGVAGSTI